MNELHQQTKLMLELIKGSGGLYEKPRIDYYEFRNRWLPLFNYGFESGQAPLGEWVQQVCLNHAFMDVDVVKGGRKIPNPLYPGNFTIEGGEYMFTVPPVLNRDIVVELKSGRTIDSVVVNAQRQREVLAKSGDALMNKEIVNGVSISIPVDPMLFERMNKIFEHYGVQRTLPTGITKNTEKSNHTTEAAPEEKIDNDLLDFNF